MLANFKKLANSCLHTSNSRQITTRAKFATKPSQSSGTHEELPLVSWSYCMLFAEEETESAGKIESFGRNLISVEIPSFTYRLLTPVSPLVLPFSSACFLCLYALQTKRPKDLDSFELPRLIEKLHVRLHVRPPFCEVPRKSREKSACFDWLTVTNTRLPTVHTSNTSLPTRKSW